MSLQTEVQVLRKQCEEMEEAIALIRQPQKYEPRQGENSPLDFLKNELSVINSQAEREELLQRSEAALEKSRAVLQAKQVQLQQLKDDCELIRQHMLSAGTALLALQSSYRQSLAYFEELAKKNEKRWQELHGNQELFTKLGAVEFPKFCLRGCAGVLGQEAIVRDLD